MQSRSAPASAFVGVLITGWLNRRTAKELEGRSRREEVMRLRRWASELAVSDDFRKAELGVHQLSALADSDLLNDEEKSFVDAALETVLAEPLEEIEELETGGEEIQVVQRPVRIALGHRCGRTIVGDEGKKADTMTKRVYVTSAQARAAKKLVARSAVTGRFVSSSMKKIATAEPSMNGALRDTTGHNR